MSRIFFTLYALAFSFTGSGQNITGNWEGVLNVKETKIPIVFHISKDTTGNLMASFDSPKQNAFNLPCSHVMIKEDSVILIMQTLNGRYVGQLNKDKKQLTGTWYQGGSSLPLIMYKASDIVTTKKINRPQTPKPPFPYKSEDVEYDNAEKTIHFGGTFTVPIPDPNVQYFRAPIYPVVLLITGSGKQDRDETIFSHKPFAIIADHLTRQGIAVLRVDDRGMNKTTGDFSRSTSADFANDVEAGIDYLKRRNEVDIQNIGLLGHSEGGMIAPMVASKRKDVKFIVLLAGPGVKNSDLLEQQSVDIMASMGISRNNREQYRLLYRQLINTIANEPDSVKAYDSAMSIFNDWQKGKSRFLVKRTTNVSDEKTKSIYIKEFVRQISSPWYRYFIKFDPADYLTKVDCPVLALNGSKDIQVAPKQNLDAIKNALEKNKNKNFKIVEVPGLNHLFQHCKKCTFEEYNELEESFDPGTLKLISDWIKETAH